MKLPVASAGLAALVLVSAGCSSTPAAHPGGPGAAAASPGAARAAGVRSLASLSLEEKVGQLFLVGGTGVYRADDDPEFVDLLRLVEETGIGGVVWFQSEVGDTALLDARLQAKARVPLFVAADLESGLGMRFPRAVWGPYDMALAATGDVALAERRARITAVEARALGINQVYAPVADVNVNPANPVINVRSFGEDPSDVARFVVATVKGLQEGGVTATLKHFPGHGDTATDSHRSLPVLDVDRARLEKVELVPFRAGIAAGARQVMVAHIAVPRLDPTPAPVLAAPERNDVFTPDVTDVQKAATLPATLSPVLTGELLRRDLGFDGLVVTDAMTMGGVVAHFEPGEAAVRAILAGCDLVILSPDTRGAVAAVLAAARSGRIPEARIDRSVARILAEKERLGLFRERTAPVDAIPSVVATRPHLAVEEEIARRSLTLYREEAGVLPLGPGRSLAHVVVLDEKTFPGPEARLRAELKARLGEVPTVRLDPGSCDADVAAAVEAAAKADVVLVSLFVRARSGAGKIAIPDPGKAALERLRALAKPVVAVAFGSPYLVTDTPGAGTFLCGYGPQPIVQAAAVRALFGEAPIEGKLPVTVPGLFPRGTGIRKEAVR